MSFSGSIICFLAPLGYLMLRWYVGRSMRWFALLGGTVFLFCCCNMLNFGGNGYAFNSSFTPKVILWSILIMSGSAFGYGTIKRMNV